MLAIIKNAFAITNRHFSEDMECWCLSNERQTQLIVKVASEVFDALKKNRFRSTGYKELLISQMVVSLSTNHRENRLGILSDATNLDLHCAFPRQGVEQFGQLLGFNITWGSRFPTIRE